VTRRQGGHTDTFTDPETGTTINYGVQTYVDYGPARAFFERFNISTQPTVNFAATQCYLSDSDGTNATYYYPTVPAFPDELAAMQKYLVAIQNYTDYLLPGYWNFPPGDQIPEDFLLLWPEFEAKYGIQDMEPLVNLIAGVDGRPDELALYTIMNFPETIPQGFLDNTFFDPLPLNLSILYGRAQDLLSTDLYLQSNILSANRSDGGASLLVQSVDGAKTLFKAKTLLVSAQPSLKNLAGLNLDEHELSIFSTWSPSASFASVVKTNIVPENTTFFFVPDSAAGAALPYNFQIYWMGVPNYYRVLFNSQRIPSYTPAEAQAAILAGFQKVADAGTFGQTTDGQEAYSEIAAFADHSTVKYNQTVEMLKDGFMQDLYGLQGYMGTWYTGDLWCPDYSSQVWAFTDTVLPKLVASL
jgi:hypothetical protein